ncbi:MmcQ/YjbR family DNA-binding protein [Runella sp.]|uniref:MmcQ/YjbR family DNA-binding protein n=1 Tax=Runella sp. TaxID=1960881 RepID=UPI003D0EB16B
MNIESFQTYCLSKQGVTEEFPFGEETLVYKVMGKIFALTSLGSIPLTINLKCDPEKAAQLREEYDCVLPGYHMNKKHWNTITVDGSVKDIILREWIDHSYNLVVQSLPRKIKEQMI